MSIDKQVFVELVGELETYYKREFTPFVKRVWYKHLSDCLTRGASSIGTKNRVKEIEPNLQVDAKHVYT